MTPEFEILDQFLGWGNPQGQYWFIGIEEADEWCKDDAKDQTAIAQYKKKIVYAEPGQMQEERNRHKGRFTPIYDIMSEIVLRAGGQWAGREKARDYTNNQLFHKSSDTFQINLFPLGKRSLASWPQDYKRRFGFESKKEYMKYVRNGCRLKEMIYNEWKRHNPNKITVCFGVTEWPLFKKALRLSDAAWPQAEDWLQVYVKERVILCPFLSPRPQCMPSGRRSVLANEVKKFINKA
jgi:hypothetical protein